ncbi:cellulose synthase operon protein YhjQ/BcsQ [Asticcacaulis sp. EMRT-3]|uniref:AAA family ATPase n=1 Tax=Asticcacaulis sp. EMRT-3 TaxID=3040349 RepID=UPI0024AE9E01|nr:cellulose synthase operon protein YhjQ/BcsQ [Asticcacaulis sp. EMRT-3]MDI7776018.1 cellulose synthase operon protein YhjQ/BcsQ [Asticcacaulis sp. EMRT-3]
MANPAKHNDPFDSLDDLDDEFVDYHATPAKDDYDLAAPASFDEDGLADDPFAEPVAEAPLQRQAFANHLGLREPAPAFAGMGDHDDIGAISIPRIAIHFFPDSPASLQACDTAALDRRMARAQSLVRPGGIEAAIQTYHNEPTPSLLIVESTERGAGLLDQLGRLAEVCDANTKVVVIGAHNDISLYRELIRQGVSEYVVAPIQPLQLIKSIGGLFNDPETPFVGRAIAFVGARGGAGSSSIAHNFAYNLSEQMQSNTVIVDYDLPFGTAGLDFNQDPLHGIADALGEPDRLDSVLLDRMLTKCTDRLSLFSSPATLDQDYTADEDTYSEVTRKVRAAAPYIVMDLPHIWTPWLKANLIAADEVVIVATPDLASLRNAKNIIDLLKHSRPNDSAPKLVLNQMDIPGRPEIPVKDFTAALGLEPCCLIPFDARLFGQASNNGQMIAECGPASKVADSLNRLTTAITGRSAEAKARKSFLGSLFKK